MDWVWVRCGEKGERVVEDMSAFSTSSLVPELEGRRARMGVWSGSGKDSQMEPMAVMEMSPTSQMFPTRTLTLHAKNSWTTVATMPTMAGSSHDVKKTC